MYNPSQAASPYEAASAATNTPQGISSYMSPYLNSELSGISNLAQQNWNQFTAPSINNSFISAGQSGSGRNAQVIGQQANLAEQALTANLANAANSAYATAGQQANSAASNLSGLGSLAGSTAASEASNLQNIGTGLGNLQATQSGALGNAATNLANTANTVQNTGITGASALSAIGQQQQNQNQANINTAIQNFNAQNLWPETQESFMNSIINGLPSTGGSQTQAGQTPTTTNMIGSTSPLSTLAGGLLGAAGVTAKEGGLIKGYAEGGQVQDDENDAPGFDSLLSSLLNGQNDNAPSTSNSSPFNPPPSQLVSLDDYRQQNGMETPPIDIERANMGLPVGSDIMAQNDAVSPLSSATSNHNVALAQTSPSGISPISGSSDSTQSNSESPLQAASQDPNKIRQYQLLAMAKGFLTPSHSPAEALGNALGNYAEVGLKEPVYQGEQQDVIGKQLGNATAYGKLAYQNAANAALGYPTVPLPNIAGLGAYGQQIQNAMQQSMLPNPMSSSGTQSSNNSPAQSAVTTANGNLQAAPAGQGQLSNGAQMSPRQALQIVKGQVSSSNEDLLNAVRTLQGSPWSGMVPEAAAEQAKQYAQDKAKLAQAQQLSYATSQGELPAKISAERAGFQNLRGAGDNPSALYDPLAGGFVAEGSQKGIVPAGQTGAGTPFRLPPSVGGQNGIGGGSQQNVNITPNGINVSSGANTASSSTNGLPSGATQTGLAPQQTELLKQGAADMIEKQRPAYEASQQTLNGSAVIDSDITALGDKGWFAPGAGAASRSEAAKYWNGALTAAGFTPKNNPAMFANVDKIATGEELNKQTVNLGFNLARTMGARESQQVVEQAIKINPGLGTTYLGGKMVNSLIAENAQRTKDQYEFKMNALNNGIDPLTAEVQFNKQYPGTAYVKRAISEFAPPTISSPQQAQKLLPGTVFKTPNGNRKVVPMSQDYQFSMPPTNRQFGGQ